MAQSSEPSQAASGVPLADPEEMRLLLESIVANSEDAIIATRLDGTVAAWNGAAERLYGYAAREIVGQPVAVLMPPGRPHESDDLRVRLLRGERIARFETVRRRKDGALIPVSLTVSPIRDASGRVTGGSAIVRDMSDRRQAERVEAVEAELRQTEARYREILDALPLMIYSVDPYPPYRPIYVSRGHEALGYSHAEWMTPLWIQLLHPDDRERVLKETELAMTERRSIESEYRLLARDGSIHWVFDCGRFLYDASGRPWARQGFSVDITDKRSLEEQLRQSQKMDAVGQLAGGIAHDFNNLLTAIQGYAGFIGSSLPPDDDRRNDVKEILDATHRAAALTRQLLTFSRRQPLAPQVLRLGEVVSGLAPMLRRLLGESIELQVTERDRTFVSADAAQIEQVLMNLCINARDAMPNGGHLAIDTEDVSGESGGRPSPLIGAIPHVRLRVVDTGHGMDLSTQARIFEPFFTTKPTGQGTGLGLATVYAIVKQSGGHIEVRSRVGHGAQFDVYLPQTDEPARVDPLFSPPNADYRAEEAILLVEDDPAVREFVHRVLTRQGYIVHDMPEPARAIEFSRAHRAPIELIVSDVVLPEMSGPEMTRLVQRFHPEARVLFVSGFTANQIEGDEAEQRFLQKPFSGETLLRKVRAVLDAPRSA